MGITMDYIVIILLAAGTFGLCFLADKGFQKAFRSRREHISGKAVRLNKKYGTFGMILIALGLAGALTGLPGNWTMVAAGAVLTVVGIGLAVYYLTFGIFYDGESFLYAAFCRKARRCTYGDIRCQQLYILQGGSILVELHMADGSAVPVQLSLTGAPEFLTAAAQAWAAQTHTDLENAPFYDPDNSRWFPDKEDA